MNKAELVGAIADRTEGQTRVGIEAILNAAITVILEQVASGGVIRLSRLGVFDTREASARQGRNPATGDVIDIPARRLPRFKPAKEFKELVNG